MKTSLHLAGIGVLTAAVVLAQGADACRDSRIRGEISPVPAGAGMLTVELSGNDAGPTATAVVNGDGSFEVRSAQPGAQVLRLVGAGGAVLHQETVVVSCGNQSLVIRPHESAQANRSADGTISVQQLAHKVPAQARKAFDKGEQAETKGDHQAAMEMFRQAVTIDPGFADAFNELGAVEASQGDLAQAIDDFQKAIDAVPDHKLALANLSIVLAKARRFDEAVGVARRALKVMPESGTVRYVLATSLLFTDGDTDEVLDNLERASGDVPLAHLLVAQLLVRRDKRDEAIRHVEEYLRLAPADDKERSRAEAMLTELQPK
jgi:tetratricopeptide (TPR) repeat protein